MSKKESFLVNRLRSVNYALKGALYLIKTEASIKVQVVLAIAMTAIGFYFELSKTEWIIQILTIGLVMGIEGVNTAIEYLADFIHPGQHEKIGRIKDISAGAVFIAATTAVIVGGFIYLPKIF